MQGLARFSRLLTTLGVFLGLASPGVRAETGDTPAETVTEPVENGADDGLTPDERAAIEKALAEDAAVETPAPPAPPPNALASLLQSMAPNISLILDVALAAYSSDNPDQRGAHDPVRSGFNFQQLELNMNAAVDPFFRFDTNIVFAQFGVEVEEAYITSLAFPEGLQLRAGQFLTRFGRRNATHPHSWNFLDQPLVLGKFFGGEGNRGLGAELSWLMPLPWYSEVLVSVNDAGGDCCNRSYRGGLDAPLSGPEDLLYTFAWKQFFPFNRDLGLNWGLSAQFGPNATGAGNRTAIIGTDLYLRYKPTAVSGRMSLDLTVELLARSRSVPGRVLQDWGGFAELRWLIDLSWAVAARYEWVSGVEDDPLDPEWDQYRHRTAAAFDFYPSHFSRFRLQLSHDAMLWREEPVWGIVLGVEVVTGDHGSHGF
jgi:hypothetical protein